VEAEAGGDDAAAVVVVGRMSVVVAARSTARRMELLRRGLLCRVAPILSTVWGLVVGRRVRQGLDWAGWGAYGQSKSIENGPRRPIESMPLTSQV